MRIPSRWSSADLSNPGRLWITNKGWANGELNSPRSSRTGQRAFDEAASLRPRYSMRPRQLRRGLRATNHPAKWLPTIFHAESLCLSSSTKAAIMAEINKLSVEKALDNLRAGDAKQSKEALFNDNRRTRWKDRGHANAEIASRTAPT